jgi:hypothetical protein
VGPPARTYSGQLFFAAMAVFVAGRALLDPLRHDASPEVYGAAAAGADLRARPGAVLAITAAVQRGKAADSRDGLRLWEGGPWSPKP